MTQAAFTAEVLPCTPQFDMMLFMQVSQETRIGGDTMDKAMNFWTEYMPALKLTRITCGALQYLLVELDASVEESIDILWKERSSEGFFANALAQSLIMAAAHMHIPEIEDAGCAPAPKPTLALREALDALGVSYVDDGPALSRRFAVVTPMPFKGGCETCVLLRDCPKGLGKEDAPTSFELPGHRQTLM